MIKKSDFWYDLPNELIAQTPLEQRDTSRLLHVDRASGVLKHLKFSEFPSLLNSGDLLILNDTKVFPARLRGVKAGTVNGSGGVEVELLLLKQTGVCEWECMVKPGRRLKFGTVITLNGGADSGISAVIGDTLAGGNRIVRFCLNDSGNSGNDDSGNSGNDDSGNSGNDDSGGSTAFRVTEILTRIGEMPLPPYIHEKLTTPERYNTVYSRELGSAAAPTAGLHFTPAVFAELSRRGVETAYVTLHIGLGTFRPVKCDNIEEHQMHSEWYGVSDDTMAKLNNCKGRKIAVGTTSCRVLESVAATGKTSGDTDIFIYPGCEFRAIDALLTNFHFPESTLIMLVSAFLGREATLAAYNTAVAEKYRFFSFGDCMFVS